MRRTPTEAALRLVLEMQSTKEICHGRGTGEAEVGRESLSRQRWITHNNRVNDGQVSTQDNGSHVSVRETAVNIKQTAGISPLMLRLE